MALRIQKVDQEYHIVLTEQQMQALHLSEGTEVEVLPVSSPAPVFEFLSNEEALELYRATLPDFRADYQELAK